MTEHSDQPTPDPSDEPAPEPTTEQTNWNSAPSFSTRAPSLTPPPTGPRPRRTLPILGLAMAAGILSGGITALAVVNLAEPPLTSNPNGSGSTVADVTIDESSAVIDAVDKVAPAVVTIHSTGGLGGVSGTGSGFIFDPDGWILTNKHVVDGASQLVVELKDGRTFTATLVGTDTLTDLAIIHIDATGLASAPIGSSEALEVGQLAIAIGNPLGTYRDTVTTGVVSGLGRQISAGGVTSAEQLNHLIQTDAAINPGNSGGPLVNSAGQVIGINTAVASSAQGIGFAIPIDVAKPIMALALQGKPITRPWVGVYYTMIDRGLAEERNLSVDQGALIVSDTPGIPAVFPGSPAEAAGLQEGDIITAIDGRTVDQDHDVSTLLLPHVPGDTVTMAVNRDGKQMSVEVTLGTLPVQP
jgi:2-alkenal reductase